MKDKPIPEEPGVYLFKDKLGRIIYVGKARNLKNRLRSYFSRTPADPRIQLLVSLIRDFTCLVTDNELEALLLECSLIKKHKPKFNVIFKDDKQYPMLELTTSEEFPRLRTVRRILNPKNRYFGPYTEVSRLKELLKATRRVFPLRTCSPALFKAAQKQKRPCLNSQLGLCLAPCQGGESLKEYRKMMDYLQDFFSGKTGELQAALSREIKAQMEKLNFEKCAVLKERLDFIARLNEGQKVLFKQPLSADYLALAEKPGMAVVQVLKVREGKLLGEDNFPLSHLELGSRGDRLAAFLKQYYQKGLFIPKVIYLSEALSEQKLLQDFLGHLASHKVNLVVARRGLHKQLVEMAAKNAALRLQEIKLPQVSLEKLKLVLNLQNLPERVEIYDLSNLSGSSATGAMVVFQAGKAEKSEYRKFKIQTAGDLPDDYQMLREVLQRRFKQEWEKPDMMLIDGGSGHLGVAKETLRKLKVEGIDLLSLAKKENLIYQVGRKTPLVLPENSPELLFLLRARDEAHRFAITYHRKLREKKARQSVLDRIPGVGKETRKRLLSHFGSMPNLRQATSAELMEVKGVGPQMAEVIRRFLQKEFNV